MLRSAFSVAWRNSNKAFLGGWQEATKICGIGLQNSANYVTLGEAIQRFRFKYMYTGRHHLDFDKWAKVFCIEGNVGVGKSSFGKEFAEILDLRYYPTATHNYHILRMRGEVPDEMIDWELNPESVRQNHEVLDIDYFCKEPQDWVHTAKFQWYLMHNRYYQYSDAVGHLLRTGQGVTTVRHFYSDRVHAEAQRQMGWFRKDTFKFYDLSTSVADTYILPPQVVIYLDVSAEECYERIQAGDNEAEKHLPLEYLKRIEDTFKNVYIPSARERGVNVIELDWSTPTSVQEVVDDLDGLPTMLSSTNTWSTKDNNQLKKIMKYCEDFEYRMDKFDIYTPIEELWNPKGIDECYHIEYTYQPWKYQTGFNKSLGDKHIFWKDA